MPVVIQPETLSQLGDRLDGVNLLAEALAQNTALGKFRDFIRLYERAFRTPAGKLSNLMLSFLNPRFGYTTHEIDNWLDLRDRAIHADVKPERKLAYEKDVALLVSRMQQAAYDILANKKTWQHNDTERTERWIADAGTTSKLGDLYVTKGRGASIPMKILDGFGSYPLNLGGGIEPALEYLEESYWTKRIDQDVRKQGTFTVLANPDEGGVSTDASSSG
jgi:hypothetical protein